MIKTHTIITAKRQPTFARKGCEALAAQSQRCIVAVHCSNKNLHLRIKTESDTVGADATVIHVSQIQNYP